MSSYNKLYNNQDSLIGFCFYYCQWIPLLIFEDEIKTIFPKASFIMGGFYDVDSATEIMKIIKTLDFAIWGEGEYPLLELLDSLNNQQCHNLIPRLIFKNNSNIENSNKIGSALLDLNNYTDLDFDDYIIQARIKPMQQVVLPLSSKRGCR